MNEAPRTADLPLRGCAVLVTRPAHQSAALARMITAAGGEPMLFPSIEIADVPESPQLQTIFSRLAEFDLAIFISANAVQRALPRILAAGGWPPQLPVAAVGQATAVELSRQAGASMVIAASAADSEALLASEALRQIHADEVVIFRGLGGRELLAQTLQRRGARVVYAECYRRIKPDTDPAALRIRLEQGALHALTATSAEALSNLLEMLDEPGSRRQMLAVPAFVPHARIGEAGRALGFQDVHVTPAGDECLVNGIIAWRNPGES